MITSEIGIHAIFGAFLFGAVMPREGAAQLSHEILERVEQITVLVLLPVFFIVTGLAVDVGSLGTQGLLELAAVLVVACVGKFLGAMVAARAVGVPARRAGAIGVLMNARGLTELVILNIGLELDVLDDRLFTVMVLMAIITTVMTEPLLRLFYTDRMIAREAADAERKALGQTAAYRVVVAVRGSEDEHTVDAAVALLGDEADSQLVISRFDPPFRPVEVGSGLTAELAAVAESFESLQLLSQRATDAGASVIVRSQFSDDVAADLATQLRVADADVVTLRLGADGLARRIGEVAECAVVMAITADDLTPNVGPGAHLLEGVSSILVMPGSDDDGLAAVEQACRMATRTGISVSLAESQDRREQRRSAVVRKRLVAAGFPVEAAPDLHALRQDTVLVLGSARWEAYADAERSDVQGYRSILVVRGAMDDHGSGLTKMLEAPHPAPVSNAAIPEP